MEDKKRNILIMGGIAVVILVMLALVGDFGATGGVIMTGGAIGGADSYSDSNPCLEECALDFCEEGNQTCYIENLDFCSAACE